MDHTPPDVAVTPSPVFDAAIALTSKLPDSEVIAHEHKKTYDIPGKPKRNNAFFFFSYQKDFDKLWSDIKKEPFRFDKIFDVSDSTKSYTTIIVWDGFPKRNVSAAIPIEDWVTPIDWAVCAALSLDKQQKRPNWRVLIIDLVSQKHPNSQSISLQKANPALLPWIRLYRPILKPDDVKWKDQFVAESDSWYALLRSMSKDDFASFVEDVQSPNKVMGLNAYDALETLTSIWSANVVRPGDRHHIANLMAPLILCEALKNRLNPAETFGLERSISDSMTLALAEVLNVLDLIALPNQGSGNKRDKILGSVRNGLGKLASDGIDYQVYLIDDQYRLGYENILNFIIGTPGKITSFDSAKFLFDSIKTALGEAPITTPGWRKSLFAKPSILLLDLRLWYDSDKEGLTSFYKALCEIVTLFLTLIKEPFETKDNTKLVLDQQRKELAEDWAIVKRNITDYPEDDNLLSLTILPRILSIVDPFLPIILFSSSTQSQTLKAFKGYPNIITSFQKPIPSGYKANLDPLEYIDALVSALDKATKICKFKFIGEYISTTESKLFIGGCKLSYDKFKNQSTQQYDQVVYFDPLTVTTDLRRAATYFVQENYRFLTMLPFVLMERWYQRATGNRFEDVMPNSDYWAIANPRNDYVHGTLFCLENQSGDADSAFKVWQSFLGMLETGP